MEEKIPICHTIIKLLRIAIADQAMCPNCGKDLEIGKVKGEDREIEEFIESLCTRCGYSCDEELNAIEDLYPL